MTLINFVPWPWCQEIENTWRHLWGSCCLSSGGKVGKFGFSWGKIKSWMILDAGDSQVLTLGKGAGWAMWSGYFHPQRGEFGNLKAPVRRLVVLELPQQLWLCCNWSRKEEQRVDPVVSKCYFVLWFCDLFSCYSCAHAVTHRLHFMMLYLSFSPLSLWIFYAETRSE